MRKILLTTTALMMVSGTSFAADLTYPNPRYYKAVPPPIAPVWTWTGVYVGVNAGSGWGNNAQNVDIGAGQSQPKPKQEYNDPVPSFAFPGANFNLSQVGLAGFVAGGQIGANYQVGFIVFGVEGSFDWANLNGNSTCMVAGACNSKVPWIADLTGRAGFAIDRALIYVKGGVAFAEFDFTDNVNLNPLLPSSATGSGNDTRTGFVLGAGVEYAFLPNWSAKFEYDFYDFATSGNSPLSLLASPAIPVTLPATVNNEERFHLIKFGINYKLF